MEFITPLVYLIVNIIDAWTDRKRIVKHKRGAYIYAAICLIVAWPLLDFTNVELWDVILFPLLTRAAFFDTARNLFAKQNWLYEGDKNKIDKSFFDEFEAWLGISTFWLRIIYFVAYIIYLIVYLC